MKNIQTLAFDGLCFQHQESSVVINNASFQFESGQNYLIKSDQGAGKSSLLKIIAGLTYPQKGRYLINDQNVLDMSFEEFLPIRLKIGYSFDYGGLIHNLTIKENLSLPMVYHSLVSEKEAQVRVDALLKKFDIFKFANERPSSVPGRVRKMACLLRPLVLDPEVLVLDEPSLGLSNDGMLQFVDHIKEMQSKGFAHTIFLSSQDEKLIRCFDHEVLALSEGQVYRANQDVVKKVVHL